MAHKKGNNRGKEKREVKDEIENEIINFKANLRHPNKILDKIRVTVEPRSKNQQRLVELINSKEIILCSGFPGSGKTFLACAEALRLLKQLDSPYKKIYLIRSVVSLQGEELGFLKGDLAQKTEVYMDLFLDNFNQITGESVTRELIEAGKIEFLPLSYIRGRSLKSAVILVDETQNIDINNIRTVMSRFGKDCKMILTGDVKQKDLRNKKESSLEIILKKFKERENKSIGTVELNSKEDIQRHELIGFIEEVFDEIDEERTKK